MPRLSNASGPGGPIQVAAAARSSPFGGPAFRISYPVTLLAAPGTPPDATPPSPVARGSSGESCQKTVMLPPESLGVSEAVTDRGGARGYPAPIARIRLARTTADRGAIVLVNAQGLCPPGGRSEHDCNTGNPCVKRGAQRGPHDGPSHDPWTCNDRTDPKRLKHNELFLHQLRESKTGHSRRAREGGMRGRWAPRPWDSETGPFQARRNPIRPAGNRHRSRPGVSSAPPWCPLPIGPGDKLRLPWAPRSPQPLEIRSPHLGSGGFWLRAVERGTIRPGWRTRRAGCRGGGPPRRTASSGRHRGSRCTPPGLRRAPSAT